MYRWFELNQEALQDQMNIYNSLGNNITFFVFIFQTSSLGNKDEL